jgi:hypothetical protein
MLDSGLPDHHLDGRLASTYIIDPIVFAKRSQALSYSFLERIRRHLDRVFDPFHVVA